MRFFYYLIPAFQTLIRVSKCNIRPYSEIFVYCSTTTQAKSRRAGKKKRKDGDNLRAGTGTAEPMLTAVGPGTGKRGGGTSERAGAGGLYGTCAACLPGAAEMPTGGRAVAMHGRWTS